DGAAWRRVFGSSSAHFAELLDDILKPVLHPPRHPVRLVRFGLAAAAPATLLARSWRTPQGRALFGGVAAHAFSPLNRPRSSSVGCALINACHAFGWPVAKGGSQAITEALASALREHGGRIETGRPVADLSELGGAEAVVFDLAPGAVAEIAADRLPAREIRSEEHTSELQSLTNLVCRLLLEKKKKAADMHTAAVASEWRQQIVV